MRADDCERLFFALWPGPTVRDALAEVAAAGAGAGAKRVPRENLHITLAFLGPVERAVRPRLERAAAAVDGPPFRLTLDRIGAWPRPGILWSAPAVVPEALGRLHRELAAGLEGCGYAAEARPFRPHVTLARKHRGGGGEARHPAIRWEVSAFHLTRSDTRPAGARYEIVGSWALTG